MTPCLASRLWASKGYAARAARGFPRRGNLAPFRERQHLQTHEVAAGEELLLERERHIRRPQADRYSAARVEL